jgi:hypothetical protein
MTDHLFDKFIKNKLNDYSSAVPEGLWEKIQQEKDKRPLGLWWKNPWLISLIGVATIFAGALLWQNNNSNNLNISAPSSVSINPQASGSNNVNSITQTNQGHNAIAFKKNTNDNVNVDNINEGTNNDVESSITTLSNKRNSNKDYTASSGTVESVLTGFKNRAISERTSSSNNGTNSFKNADNYTEAFKHTFFATAQNDKNFFNQPFNEQLLNGLKGIHLFGGEDCPSARGPLKNDIYLEVFASPDYAKKTINNSGGNDAFVKRKDSTESMRISYTAGLRLSKTVGDHMLLKAGLQYSQINEKFNYRTENERRVTTVITIRTVVRAPGDTAMVRDTSTVEQIGYRVKTTYNRYKSIDVPLILAYEWGNDNFKAAVSGGVILNLHSWAKGESLDTSYVPVPFDKNTGQTFKQNIGVGVYASLSLIKRVSEKAELFMEPYARYNISNMTNNKSLYNQKFEVAGINLGIRYKINRSGQRYYNR